MVRLSVELEESLREEARVCAAKVGMSTITWIRFLIARECRPCAKDKGAA